MQMTSLPTVQQLFSDFLLSEDNVGETPTAWAQPPERLQVYKNAFWYRLLESLHDDFPRLTRALGDSDALFRHFIRSAKNRGHSLLELSREVPRFLAQCKEVHAVPAFAEDLARWEWTQIESFLNRGLENRSTPSAQMEWQKAILSLHPSARMMTLKHDVIDGEPPFHEWPQEESVILWYAAGPQWHRLTPEGSIVAHLLQTPRSLNDFVDALRGDPQCPDDLTLQTLINDWTASGLLVIEES